MASLDLYWHDDEFVDMDERRIRFIRLGDLSEPSDADKVYKPTLDLTALVSLLYPPVISPARPSGCTG